MMIHKEQTHTAHSFTLTNVISDAQTLEMILEKHVLVCGTGKKYTKTQSKCSIIFSHEQTEQIFKNNE
jgi:tRNA A37 threonylcarbamoyladenosine dehydratase